MPSYLQSFAILSNVNKIAILSYELHPNGFNIFACRVIFEVYDTVNNGSLEKMNDIVKTAVTMCTGVYILVGFFGYVAFCQQPFSGNILMSLEPTFASDVIKIGFVLSVACSFPLVIFPCRASFYSLLYRRVG